MKNIYFLIFFLLLSGILTAQKIDISEDLYLENSGSYNVIGKFNDQILFHLIQDNKVKIIAFDNKMHKKWEKDILIYNKTKANVLNVLPNQQGFVVINQRFQNRENLIEVHKYNIQANLIDSFVFNDFRMKLFAPAFFKRSENNKVVLVYEIDDYDNKSIINALALSLDSLRPIWQQTLEINNWNLNDNFSDIIINNDANAIFIKEENNGIKTLDKHKIIVLQIGKSASQLYQIPLKGIYTLDAKFKYDNTNQRLSAIGIYSNKDISKGNGYFMITIPPQYKEGKSYFHAFDNQFITSIYGEKKVSKKSLDDLKIQDIIHRKDGGLITIIEHVRKEERLNNSPTSKQLQFIFRDYFYGNSVALSLHPDGTTHWKSIFYKKQASQDDDARFCSYFLVKTPSALRFIFNDEIKRSTTVSEYLLTATGQAERHAIMNTEGQDINLRFRDAMQISANEVIVPSDDRRRVKLVKIQY